MEHPSLMALKLALHDGDDGIRHDSLECELGERTYIKSLCIRNAQIAGNGQELKVSFSPWFTSIIGGRGTGKSSVVEFMRIALAATSGMPDSISHEFENFKKVPKTKQDTGMLRSNTEITVHIVKNHQERRLTWIGDVWTEEVRLSGAWGPKQPAGDLTGRYPFRVFNQKQIYELTKTPDALLAIIDLEWNNRDWKDELGRLSSEYLEKARCINAHQSQITLIGECKIELTDVIEQIKLLEEKQPSEVFKQYDTISAIIQEFNGAEKKLAAYCRAIEQTNDLLQMPTLPSAAQLGDRSEERRVGK